MIKWINHEFSSGTTNGEDFKAFARDFKKRIQKDLKNTDMELEKFSIGHYYLSGFIKRRDKYVYFSIPDVRHFGNEWFNDILIRTAKGCSDFKGGHNNRTDLSGFCENVKKLFNEQ